MSNLYSHNICGIIKCLNKCMELDVEGCEMISLGIHVGHDRGAALIKNGMLVGAIAEERLDRVKFSHSTEIPFKSIDALLKYHNINFVDIDNIGITFAAVKIDELKNYYTDQLCDYYKVDSCNIVMVSHHLAHAETAFNTSDFEEAIILVADGGGDLINGLEEAESVFWGNKSQMSILERRLQSNIFHKIDRKQNHLYPFMNPSFLNEKISLGKKYEQISQMIGFGQGQEGKTMGLAPYGKSLINFKKIEITDIDFELTFGEIVDEIYFRYCKSSKTYKNFILDEQANIARTAQDFIENKVLGIVKYIVEKYKIKHVCLGGGVFLNCVLNHKICKLIKNKDIDLHICPATGDDGQSIGAAFAAHKLVSTVKRQSCVLPFLGFSYTSNDIENCLEKIKNINYTKYNEDVLISIVANKIHKNKIVAIFRGKGEIGPRALGHRSILANPKWEGMKDYLNYKVKHREDFRPFAPIVIEEEQFRIFNLEQDSPFMLFAATVKKEYKEMIPSVVHVDNTARIQSVKKTTDSFLYKLLLEYKKLSGLPVLLNTSFNDANEPIVETPIDAIRTYLNTEIDYLVIENYLITKES